METYTVGNNEQLEDIAQKFNISVKDLINANNLPTYFLKPGDILYIPPTNVSAFISYTVERGDTIFMGNNEH